jgi:hypothetical protein
MFIVCGYHTEREQEKWIRNNPKGSKELISEYEARKAAAFNNFTARRLKEYDTLSTAQDYLALLAKAGYVGLSIKIIKLYPTGSKKRPVSRTMVDVSEMGGIDGNEQAHLRAIGGL